MKLLQHLTAPILLLTFLALLFTPPLKAAVITEWNVPGELSSIPRELVVDNDGWLWFTEYGGHEIGRFKDGAFREFFISSGSYPWGIDFDSPDWIYYTDSTNRKISRIASSGASTGITEFSLPSSYSTGLRGIAVQDSDTLGADDYIWFADYGGHRIGLLDLTGGTYSVTGWTLPSDSTPESLIYTGSTGLWCTDFEGDKLWNVPNSTSAYAHIVKYVKLPDGSEPVDIDVDSFGNLWSTLSGRNSIAKYNPRLNELTEYKIPTSASKPHGIAVDYSNRVWFTESATNRIVVFNPDSETFVEYLRVGAGSPTYLATNREDHNKPRRLPMFFSDSNFGKIGKIDPYTGFTTLYVQTLTRATTTSSTDVSTSTLATTGTSGYLAFTAESSSTTADLVYTDETATTLTATETVKIVRTSTSDVSTEYSTVEGTTSTLTTVTGTYTSYIATTTGTLSTTKYATSTSYIATRTGTTTTYETTTSYTTAFQTTTTGVIIVPGYRPSALLVGLAIGLVLLLSWKTTKRRER